MQASGGKKTCEKTHSQLSQKKNLFFGTARKADEFAARAKITRENWNYTKCKFN